MGEKCCCCRSFALFRSLEGGQKYAKRIWYGGKRKNDRILYSYGATSITDLYRPEEQHTPLVLGDAVLVRHGFLSVRARRMLREREMRRGEKGQNHLKDNQTIEGVIGAGGVSAEVSAQRTRSTRCKKRGILQHGRTRPCLLCGRKV